MARKNCRAAVRGSLYNTAYRIYIYGNYGPELNATQPEAGNPLPPEPGPEDTEFQKERIKNELRFQRERCI